ALGLDTGRAPAGDRHPGDRLVLGHYGPVPPAGRQAGPDEAGRLFDVDVLRAPQREVVAGWLVVAQLGPGSLADVGVPAPGLRQFPAQVLAMLSRPGDQETPRANHRQRHSRPVGETERPGDAAPGEPGAQLVGLDRLEQPRRPARSLRPRGMAL